MNTKSSFCHGPLSPLTKTCGLKRRGHRRGPITLDDVDKLCKEEWSQILFFVFHNLITVYVTGEDCALLLAKGGHTKY